MAKADIRPIQKKVEKWTPPLDKRVARSHCRRAGGMENIIMDHFVKYSLPLIIRRKFVAFRDLLLVFQFASPIPKYSIPSKSFNVLSGS